MHVTMMILCYHVGIYSVTTDDAVYEAVPNSSLVVRCMVDADPPPVSIVWKRGGLTYTTQFFEDPLFGIIQKTVTLEDNGTWACSASNMFAGLAAGFAVVVLGK